MEDYKSNSDKARHQEAESEKKLEAVIDGAKIRKRSTSRRFANALISEDANNVKSYIFSEVVVPAAKKAISDVVTTGIDMILYGEGGSRNKRGSAASKISYRNFYDQDKERRQSNSAYSRRNSIDYDDILFKSRGEAEAVLDGMYEAISKYGTVSIADFYDLARVPNDNFTLNRYGWTELRGTAAVRVREGYILKLPRAIALD